MPAGRPTDYLPEYCEKIIEHFDQEPFSTTMDETSGKLIRSAILLPTLTNFAKKIGVARCTIYEWAERHPEFSDAVKRAQELQEEILMQNGLFGGYEKTFAIFTAKNVLGWRDKQDVEHSGGMNIGSMPDDQLAKEIAKLAAAISGGN